MAVTNTIDIFSTYTMLAVVETIVPESFFFRDRYFPTEENDIFNSDEVLVEYRKGDRQMAAFVSPRIGSIPVERGEYEIHKYAPAHIGVSRPLRADDLKKRGFGEALYSKSTPAQRALRLQKEDFIDLDRRISRREEWMSIQTMRYNACKMQEYLDEKTKGQVRYIKFYEENNSEHTYTVANKWSSNGADISGDVEAMCDLLSERGLIAEDLVLGKDVAKVFSKNPNILKLLDKNLQINFGGIDEKIIYPGIKKLGVFNFGGYILTVWVANNTYEIKEDKKSMLVPYFPTDSVMVSFPKCGRMMYGNITQINPVTKKFETIAAKRIPKLHIDEDNDTRSLRLRSRPLAAPKTHCPFIFAEKVI